MTSHTGKHKSFHFSVTSFRINHMAHSGYKKADPATHDSVLFLFLIGHILLYAEHVPLLVENSNDLQWLLGLIYTFCQTAFLPSLRWQENQSVGEPSPPPCSSGTSLLQCHLHTKLAAACRKMKDTNWKRSPLFLSWPTKHNCFDFSIFLPSAILSLTNVKWIACL